MDRRMFGLGWLGLLLRLSLARSQTSALPTDGFVTFYDPPQGGIPLNTSSEPAGLLTGACGYQGLPSTTWPYWNVVGLSANSTIVNAIGANRLGCGSCVLVTCLSASCNGNATEGIVLWVADTCEGCQEDQLNVGYTTFQEYFTGDLSLGQVEVSYQQVDCHPPGNISVKVISSRASQGGYIALALLSVAESGAIAAIDIRSSGSTGWAPMSNGYGAVWQASRLGVPPLDLRITSNTGEQLIASRVITEIANMTFPTDVQFGAASAPLPSLNLPSALPATPPSLSSVTPTPQAVLAIDAPLYYGPLPPLQNSQLLTYPGTVFSYADCADFGSPVLNLTIDHLTMTTEGGASTLALGLHTLIAQPFRSNITDAAFVKLVDYSFYNLETGEFTILNQPKYLTLTNTSYLGLTPVEDLDTQATVYPVYRSSAAVEGPSGFDYNLLEPPAANQQATPEYLNALKLLYYNLATLTLGNSGSVTASSAFCMQGYSQVAPWTDYLRGVISQVAPEDDIVGIQYDNIPLGPDFYFQGNLFTIDNAIIQGNIIQSSRQLSTTDCAETCLLLYSEENATSALCSAWTYCGSITGCSTTTYQTCLLKNSTAAANTTTPSGFLNLQTGDNIRATSGVLALPIPTNLPAYNATGNGLGAMVLVSSLTP